MSERYLLGTEGVVQFALETDPYTQETDGFDELGYTNEAIEPPNENPHTPMGTGGHDGPYINSPDPREHEFDASTVPVDERAPLEIAMGNRTVDTVDATSDGTPDYEQYLFTVERPLPTATIRHIQLDADLQTHYVGAKADVDISWSMGEPVDFDFSITAAEQTEPEAAPTSFDSSLPTDLQPYRAQQQGTVSVTDDNGFNREIATVTGGNIGITNGLEVNHHGEGREGYSVSEETNAERFSDNSLDFMPRDKELYERAAKNEAPVDVEVPFVRNVNADGVTDDALFIRANNSPIVDAPMPYEIEGSLESTLSIQPLEFEVEIRRPA